MRAVLFVTSLLVGTPALAWEEQGDRGLMRSTTRVVSILHDGVQPYPNADPGEMYAYVVLEDDTTEVCRAGSQYAPRNRSSHDGPPATRYVYVGQLSARSGKANLAALVTAKASGAEVTVLLDPRVCRLVALEY